MNKLKRRLFEAGEYFRKVNNEAFEASRRYMYLQAKMKELREEWLSLCEVLKPKNGKSYGHLTGLIMLKQRMHNAYRDVRLESLRTLKRGVELLAETNRAYRKYMNLKRRRPKYGLVSRRRSGSHAEQPTSS